jgi:hypothetical protein
MLKGYPFAPPLQTTPRAESSITHRHIYSNNCGEIAAAARRVVIRCSQ